MQKELSTTRLQMLEESNTVKYWKEKFADLERKAEELEVNLAEVKNQIEHKEANRHSQVTQTDEHSYVSNTISTDKIILIEIKYTRARKRKRGVCNSTYKPWRALIIKPLDEKRNWKSLAHFWLWFDRKSPHFYTYAYEPGFTLYS